MTIIFDPTKEQTASEYSDTHAELKSVPWIPYNPPFPLYMQWGKRLPAIVKHINLDGPVFDVGCGIGLLGAALHHSGHVERYVGVDFSEEYLQMAAEGNRKEGHQNVTLYLKDVKDHKLFTHMPEGATVVLTEILEHIVNDVAIVRRIPKGTPVVITVPRGDDPGHVRIFETLEDANDYYAPHVNIKLAKEIHCGTIIVGTAKGHIG